MNYENSKNDNTAPATPERITLVDCLRLNAEQRHRSLVEGPMITEQETTPRVVSRDKLRKIFDDVMGILEDSAFESEDDE